MKTITVLAAVDARALHIHFLVRAISMKILSRVFAGQEHTILSPPDPPSRFPLEGPNKNTHIVLGGPNVY